MASARVEPAKPPTAGMGAKAYLKIMPKASGTLAMTTTREPTMYSRHMGGTTLPQKLPIFSTPPRTMMNTLRATSTTPLTMRGMPKVSWAEVARVLVCTKQASVTTSTNRATA